MSLPAWDGRAWRVDHDLRLVAQCVVTSKGHDATCRCDSCSIVRGERPAFTRVYVPDADLREIPDWEAPWRRTLAGRVVRWARDCGVWVRTNRHNDVIGRERGVMMRLSNGMDVVSMQPADLSPRAAERRALAGTA